MKTTEDEEVESLPVPSPPPPPVSDKTNTALDNLKMAPKSTKSQKEDLHALLRNNLDAFGLGSMPIRDIKNHGIEINLTVDLGTPRPYGYCEQVHPYTPGF